MAEKVLVAVFSASGVTKKVGEEIARIVLSGKLNDARIGRL